MITLNGKRLARNDSEMIESLFHPGGTCVGFYKPNRKSIFILNMQKERVGVISKHGVLGCATKLDDGRFWYSYGDVSIIGEWDSLVAKCEQCDAALKACFGSRTIPV